MKAFVMGSGAPWMQTCNTRQHTATRCNTLRSTLAHTAMFRDLSWNPWDLMTEFLEIIPYFQKLCWKDPHNSWICLDSVYECKYTCIHIYMYLHIPYVCVCINIPCVRVCVCACVCERESVCMWVCECLCVCVSVCLCVLECGALHMACPWPSLTSFVSRAECAWERECVCVCVSVCVCLCMCVLEYGALHMACPWRILTSLALWAKGVCVWETECVSVFECVRVRVRARMWCTAHLQCGALHMGSQMWRILTPLASRAKDVREREGERERA